MPNPFDQFDTPVSNTGNPFDQFDDPVHKYIITAPDGRKFRVTGPGTKEEALVQARVRYRQPVQAAAEVKHGADPWSQFPDAPQEDPWAQFPDAVQAGTDIPERPSDLRRSAGLAGRTIAQLLTDLPNLPGDVAAAINNWYYTKFQPEGYEVTIDGLKQSRTGLIEGPSAERDRLLSEAGLPEPETTGERLINVASRAAGGAAGIAKTSSLAAQLARQGTVGQRVASTMAHAPGSQLLAGATGATGAEVARESGAGPLGQFAAGLGAGMAPSLISAGTQAATRGLFRGGEAGRQRVAENVKTFGRAGTTPTVGQAAETRFSQAAESLLSRTPGAAGRMAAKAETQADEIAAGMERRAAQIMRKTSAEQAGRTIERGVRGEGGFVEQFRAQQGRLFDQLDRAIAPGTRVGVANTQRALGELSATIRGAEATSRRLVNPRIAALADDLAQDAVNGSVPYEAVKRVRTLVGQEIADTGLVSDVPKAQWKRVYAALSQDLETAASTAGPRAKAAWNRANNYTRAGMRRIEAIDSVIDRAGGPEAIFRAATSNTKEGATTLRAVMQSAGDEGRRAITATVLRRLGLGKAGVQNELGDRFNTETFLTNWNLLSPEAKRALFNRFGPQFRGDMDRVAQLAENLRRGSQVFRNPSGTAQAGIQYTTVGALAMATLTGQYEAAASILAGGAAANSLSRLMANPKFVRWLAQSTEMPASRYSAQIAVLANMARGTQDEDMARAAALLENQRPDQKRNAGN